jgi:glycosyl transferase family 25
MTEPIKIYVVTLPESRDRQINITAQLNALGLAFEFVFGTDGRKLTGEQLVQVFDKEKNIKHYQKQNFRERGMSFEEIGCALGHKSAYEKMIENNIECAIILEDDSLIKDGFPHVITLLNQLKTQNYLLKLDFENRVKIVPWHRIKLTNDYNIIQTSSSVWCAMGYYIDIQGAMTMLRLIKRIFCVSDEFDYFRKFLKLRLLNKAVVVEKEGAFESIIGKRDMSNKERYNDIFSKTYQMLKNSYLLKVYRYIITLFH